MMAALTAVKITVGHDGTNVIIARHDDPTIAYITPACMGHIHWDSVTKIDRNRRRGDPLPLPDTLRLVDELAKKICAAIGVATGDLEDDGTWEAANQAARETITHWLIRNGWSPATGN